MRASRFRWREESIYQSMGSCSARATHGADHATTKGAWKCHKHNRASSEVCTTQRDNGPLPLELGKDRKVIRRPAGVGRARVGHDIDYQRSCSRANSIPQAWVELYRIGTQRETGERETWNQGCSRRSGSCGGAVEVYCPNEGELPHAGREKAAQSGPASSRCSRCS